MFDHVTIRVGDLEACRRFYDTALGTLGIPAGEVGEHLTEWDDFSIAQADTDQAATRGLHMGFVAPSREQVDDFWRVGAGAGYASAGEPGERPQYTPAISPTAGRPSAPITRGLLRRVRPRPDGTNVESVHHGRP